MFNPYEATNDNNNDDIIGGDEGEEDHNKRPDRKRKLLDAQRSKRNMST